MDLRARRPPRPPGPNPLLCLSYVALAANLRGLCSVGLRSSRRTARWTGCSESRRRCSWPPRYRRSACPMPDGLPLPARAWGLPVVGVLLTWAGNLRTTLRLSSAARLKTCPEESPTARGCRRSGSRSSTGCRRPSSGMATSTWPSGTARPRPDLQRKSEGASTARR